MSKPTPETKKPSKSALKAGAKTKPAGTGAKTDPNTAPRPASKTDLLTQSLSQPGGATIEQLCSVTGWQSHSVRAAMSGFKKKGVEITRTKTDGKSVYSIVSVAEPAS